MFLEFGDDSVAQLGGAHLACEWSSNVLTKILQRGRLAAYLEQSTRYIAYDRAHAERALPLLLGRARSGAPYAEAMERHLRPLLGGPRAPADWAAEQLSARATSPQTVWERSIKAKALDAMARRCAPRVRVVVERADEDPPARPARCLPGAVHPLHPL